MGMDPLSLGLIMGGVSAAGSLFSGISQSNQQIAQAQAQKAQAENLRNSARAQAAAGQLEAENIERRKSQLRRDYEQMQGRNAVSLGAGNVDLSSGSAMDVAEGNARLFAQDVGETAYEAALKKWQTINQVRATNASADALDSQASYSQRTAQNFLPTLLGAGLSGVSGFMSGYSWGGKLPGGSQQYWDRALGKYVSAPVRH